MYEARQRDGPCLVATAASTSSPSSPRAVTGCVRAGAVGALLAAARRQSIEAAGIASSRVVHGALDVGKQPRRQLEDRPLDGAGAHHVEAAGQEVRMCLRVLVWDVCVGTTSARGGGQWEAKMLSAARPCSVPLPVRTEIEERRASPPRATHLVARGAKPRSCLAARWPTPMFTVPTRGSSMPARTICCCWQWECRR